MKRGNHSRSRFPKALALVLAMVLLVGAAIGGTIAWLTAQTPEVKNTFTSAKLFETPSSDFTLWEHKAVVGTDGRYTLNSEEVTSNSYEILPGVDIPKDPTVDVVNLLENAYLYIKVASQLPEGLSYTIDSDNWTALDSTKYPGVWVYTGTEADANSVIQAASSPKSFTANILTGKVVTVSTSYNGTANGETLTFNAYMVQATGNGANAAEAWGNAYPATP